MEQEAQVQPLRKPDTADSKYGRVRRDLKPKETGRSVSESKGTEKGPILSKIPRVAYLTKKSNVKPVPDFAKLHQTWHNKVTRVKGDTRLTAPSHHTRVVSKSNASAENKENNSSRYSHKPSVADATSLRHQKSTESPSSSSMPARRAALKSANTSSLVPMKATASKNLRANGSPSKEPISQAENQVPRADVLKRPPIRPPPQEEFDNSNFNLILESNDGSELDSYERRSGISTMGPMNLKRLTISGPAARRPTAVKRVQAQDVQSKRVSMYSGAVRVAINKPAPGSKFAPQRICEKNDTAASTIDETDLLESKARDAPSGEPFSLLEKGMSEYFQRRNNPKTPGLARIMPASQTPRQKQQLLARKMGAIVAETYGLTPQRPQPVKHPQPQDVLHTPTAKSFLHRLEGLGEDKQCISLDDTLHQDVDVSQGSPLLMPSGSGRQTLSLRLGDGESGRTTTARNASPCTKVPEAEDLIQFSPIGNSQPEHTPSKGPPQAEMGTPLSKPSNPSPNQSITEAAVTSVPFPQAVGSGTLIDLEQSLLDDSPPRIQAESVSVPSNGYAQSKPVDADWRSIVGIANTPDLPTTTQSVVKDTRTQAGSTLRPTEPDKEILQINFLEQRNGSPLIATAGLVQNDSNRHAEDDVAVTTDKDDVKIMAELQKLERQEEELLQMLGALEQTPIRNL